MLTKSSVKLIRSLKQKKFRDKHKLFVVEGEKSIREFLKNGYKAQYLLSLKELNEDNISAISVSEKELKDLSNLKNPSGTLAVFEINNSPIPKKLDAFYYALDGVRDPGNLGTIIRLADWYGITHIFCSKDCVDAYNPKVVQATMGSLARVNVHYVDLLDFLKTFKGNIFGTFMEGENIYKVNLQPEGMLVLGNEGNGISHNIEKQCTQKLSIPQFGKEHATESLNVAIAAAIVTSCFYSRK